MKKALNLSVLLIFLISSIVLEATAQKDFKWDKADPTTPIPDIFSDEDAVMIYHHVEDQTVDDGNRFFRRIIIRQRTKILTKSGLDDYGRIFFRNYNSLNIEKLDARTIKQDGSIVDLEAKDLKSLEFANNDIFDKSKYILFAAPGLEVGDELETICIYEGYEGITKGQDIYFNESIPVLESKFILNVAKKLIVLAHEFNDAQPPTVSPGTNNIKFTWTMKNLPGIYDQKGTIFGKTLPYIIYELNFSQYNMVNHIPTFHHWSEMIAETDKTDFKYTIRKDKAFVASINKILGDKVDATNVEKIRCFHNFINEEIDITRLAKNEQSNGLEYFLEAKKADQWIVMKLYKAFMDHIKQDYYLATARSKYLGDFQIGFITSIQISDYLFAIDAEGGSFHVLYPKTRKKAYAFNELPLYLEGTDFYMYNPKDETSFKKISIPNSTYKLNSLNRKLTSKVELESGNMEFNMVKTYRGAFSNLYRNRYYELSKEEELEKILKNNISEQFPETEISDISISEFEDKIPFPFTLKYKYTAKDQLIKVEDNLVKISLKDWFDHAINEVNAKKRLLDYYPEYSGVDSYTYLVEFDKPVTLVNKDLLEIKMFKDFGSYELYIQQSEPTKILIRSKYSIKKNVIPTNQVKDLEAVNEGVENANSLELLLEISE